MSQKTLLVINHGHDGYRRAGITLAKGENTLDSAAVSAAQLQALIADPRLAVLEDTLSASDASPAAPADVAQTQGSVGAADSAAAVTAQPVVPKKPTAPKKAPAKAQTVATEQGA